MPRSICGQSVIRRLDGVEHHRIVGARRREARLRRSTREGVVARVGASWESRRTSGAWSPASHAPPRPHRVRGHRPVGRRGQNECEELSRVGSDRDGVPVGVVRRLRTGVSRTDASWARIRTDDGSSAVVRRSPCRPQTRRSREHRGHTIGVERVGADDGERAVEHEAREPVAVAGGERLGHDGAVRVSVEVDVPRAECVDHRGEVVGRPPRRRSRPRQRRAAPRISPRPRSRCRRRAGAPRSQRRRSARASVSTSRRSWWSMSGVEEGEVRVP